MKINTAKAFDQALESSDNLNDVLEQLGEVQATSSFPNREVKRINLDLPTWVIQALDHEAQRIGVTRQSVIKVILAEKFS